MIFTSSPLSGLFLVGILAVIALHILHQVRQGRWNIFDPLSTFWAAVAYFYVYMPVKTYSAYLAWREVGILEATLGYIFVGMTCVAIGYQMKFGANQAQVLPQVPARLNPARMQAVALVLCVLGGVSYYYQFRSAGGLDRWLSVARGGTDYKRLSNYISTMSHFLTLGIFLFVLHVNLHRTSLAKKCVAWSLGALLWIWNVYLGSRSYTVGIACLLLVAYYLPRRRNPPVLLIATLCIGLFIITNFQRAYRGYFTDLSFNLDRIDMEVAYKRSVPSALGGGSETEPRDTSRGQEFNCVMTVVELVPSRIPYNLGYGFLHIFTLWIPRVLWPTKRYPLYEAYRDIYINGDLGASNTGINDVLAGPSFTFAGFWLSVGGPLALAVGGLLTGMLFRFLRSVYDRAPSSDGAILWLASMFPVGFGFLTGEPVLSLIHLFPLHILPCVLLFWLTRERRPAGAERARPGGDAAAARGGLGRRDAGPPAKALPGPALGLG
jgi:hypothetical protein